MTQTEVNRDAAYVKPEVIELGSLTEFTLGTSGIGLETAYYFSIDV